MSQKGKPPSDEASNELRSPTHVEVAPKSQDAVFEDYLHYAAIQRREERLTDGLKKIEPTRWFYRLSKYKGPNVDVDVTLVDAKSMSHPMTPAEAEKVEALRALRTASWISVFFLITTDILGPFNAPFAISQVGWVPGVILYFSMGLVALYTGLILWRLFIRLDSVKYPLKSYADIVERIYGPTARHICNVLSSLQLLINVATICLSNGQAESQISKGHLCFSVCIVIWAILGMVVGQIRTLKNYGWLANNAVWIKLLIIFITMGVVVHSPPNYKAAKKSLGVEQGPIKTEAFVSLPLYSKVNGIMNMVFAYGGAMIFPEIMAEMRRPMDFWKGMMCAQALIFSAYLLFGCFVYGFQGQFSLPLAYQGLSTFGWQTVGNALSLVAGIIAAGLYANIGIKLVYINIIEGWFNGPVLMSRRGRFIWSALVLVYWSLAFVVGSAIPQVQTITGLIAAIAIMQFSYTFPPFLRFGYDVITDAMSKDAPYAPGHSSKGRVDNWSQWSRWRRGLFSGRWYFKLFNLYLGLGGLAMACLGMWGAGESIKATFQHKGAATSFGCRSPVA